jgi:ketosteroid isomerase-like protein
LSRLRSGVIKTLNQTLPDLEEVTMDSLELVESIYQAFNAGDVATVLASFDPAIEWRTPESLPWSTGTYRGHAAVGRYFDAFGAALREASVDPDSFERAGDLVVARGFERATVRTTGRRFEARFVHVWRIAGDRVVAMEGVADTAAVVAASSPAPASV